MTIDISDHNRTVFALPRAFGFYRSSRDGLWPAEAEAVRLIKAERAQPIADLLDLGVGTGRTTPPLRELAGNYVGIDYAPGMVAACRARFPGCDFRVGDARDLSMLAAGSFDVVFFSFSGIDCVDHAGRLAVLAEARRLLRPCGFLFFSSHNRNGVAAVAEQPPRLIDLPRRLLGRLKRWPVIARNKRRLRPFEIVSDEYEIRNDLAHDYNMLLYHITAGRQAVQLGRAGLDLVHVLDDDGRVMNAEQGDASRSVFLNYVCRKSG